MIRSVVILMLALTAFPRICDGGEEKADPCYYEGVVDKGCLQKRYEVLDKEYIKQYREVVAALQRQGVQLPSDSTNDALTSGITDKRLDLLEQSHSAWRRYRESVCEEVYYQYYPGSLAWTARMHCLIEKTQHRISEIKDFIA